MKVLALTKYCRQGASSRFRTYQFVDRLADFGINVEVLSLSGAELLAFSEVEWTLAFEHMLADHVLRRRFGEMGKRAVLKVYSAHVQVKRIASCLTGV